MFRNLLKGLKKEAEKIIEEIEDIEEDQEETLGEDNYLNAPVGRYGRLAAWIKNNYEDRFQNVSTTDEVTEQLERILKERERKGDFRDFPEVKKGFKSYIDKKEYGDLVRISE
jgi:hypothetical protein